MGKVINIQDRRHRQDENPIASSPWEFRRACWKTPYFIQVIRPLAEEMTCDPKASPTTPPHFSLKGGMASTVLALYVKRQEEERMRETYYLIGLTDCMINQVNPVLRTDLLRAMYKKVFAMKEELNIHWHGTLDQVLLPIDSQFYDDLAYRASLRNAGSLEALYRAIRNGTDEMFDILSHEYVFYCPWVGG